MVKITTIDALRLISQRTGEYEGQGDGEFYYLDENNAPTIMSKIPLPHPTIANAPREPWAAAIPIYRKGFRDPVKVVARFDAYAVMRKDKNSQWTLNEVWARRGPEMLLKCSEAAARRAIFPEELAGLYLQEEFNKEDEALSAAPASEPVTLAPTPSAPYVPPVSQVPAEGKDAPRPSEEKPIPTLVELILHKDVEQVEQFVQNPAVQEALVAEGKQVDQAELARLKADTKPKPRGRPSQKKEPIPDNGKPAEDLGITDEDIALAGPSTTETPEERAAALADAHAFVEDVSVVATDPLPTQEQKDKFVAHVRELVAAGVDNKLLGAYIIGRAKKQKSGELTVGDWESAFVILDAAKEAGTLKEVVKPV